MVSAPVPNKNNELRKRSLPTVRPNAAGIRSASIARTSPAIVTCLL